MNDISKAQASPTHLTAGPSPAAAAGRFRVKLALFAAFLIAIGIGATFTSSYWQSVLVLFSINVIVVIGYWLITLMGGWSFAHVAIMGLGAYVTALTVTAAMPLPFWIALPLSGLVCGAFAALISYPVLRTRTFYFFLSTFAAGEALVQSFIQFPEVTGGTSGIAFIERPAPILGLEFDSTLGYLHLVLVIAFIVGAIVLRFDNSRFGDTVRAVAMNEDLSRSLGINAWLMRALPFIIGSAIAGICGSLLAVFNSIINPADFSSALMFKYVAALIIGGSGSFIGPILGLILLTSIEEIFRGAPTWVPLFWGTAVVLVVLFFKGGLGELVQRIFGRRTPEDRQ